MLIWTLICVDTYEQPDYWGEKVTFVFLLLAGGELMGVVESDAAPDEVTVHNLHTACILIYLSIHQYANKAHLSVCIREHVATCSYKLNDCLHFIILRANWMTKNFTRQVLWSQHRTTHNISTTRHNMSHNCIQNSMTWIWPPNQPANRQVFYFFWQAN